MFPYVNILRALLKNMDNNATIYQKSYVSQAHHIHITGAERHGVSNHRHLDGLFNRFSKLKIQENIQALDSAHKGSVIQNAFS